MYAGSGESRGYQRREECFVNEIKERQFRGYTFGSRLPLEDEQMEALLRLIEGRSGGAYPSSQEVTHPHNVLGGRGIVYGGGIEGLGDVVLKGYLRGGWLKLLVADRHLRIGAGRSRHEFEILETVRTLGVNAPEPLVFIEKGGLLYNAWLVTREIAEAKSLIDIAKRDGARGLRLLESLSHQMGTLIQNRIYHVDLHPGNAVVSKDDAVFIVDFDKAIQYIGSRNELRDRYLRRWRRAVIKHGLPELLSEGVCLNLRNIYD